MIDRVFLKDRPQNETPSLVANIYRLYASSILIGSEGNVAHIREAVLWLRRAIDLYSGWKDQEELVKALHFIQGLLDRPSQVPLNEMLRHSYRIGMIEFDNDKVEETTNQAVILIKQIIEASKGNQNAK